MKRCLWMLASLTVLFASFPVGRIQAEPTSVTTQDLKAKEWKYYDNRIVKVHLHIKSSWTMMEIKETTDNGVASFTLSHTPGPLVTFAITRQPMDGPFEEWVSSSSLSSLYPSGYKQSEAVFAGRKAALIKGTAPDGRLDESYFVPYGKSISQISFTAPEDAWNEYQSAFAGIKESFRWLP